MNIINCLPHDVCVYAGTLFSQAIGANVGGTEILRLPPSGVVATARSSIRFLGPLHIHGVDVPSCERTFSEITKLPESDDPDTLFVVSSVYAQAAAELGMDTSKMITPYGMVKSNGKVVGCTGLIQNARKAV